MPARPALRQLQTLARKALLGALLPLVLLTVWHVASMQSVIVPSIVEVLAVFAHPFEPPRALDSGPLAMGVLVSLLRVSLGFGLSAMLAVPLGLWIGRSRLAEEIVSPILSAGMVVSPIAWLPVTILVFGLSSVGRSVFGAESWRPGLPSLMEQVSYAVVAVVAVGAFIPMLFNASAGARSVREAHLEVVRMLGAGPLQRFRTVILPASLPAVLTGLRIGAGVAWRVIVAAEIFPGTRSGLGYMIATAQQQASYEYAFAAILVIAVIGLALDGVFRLLLWRVGRWQEKQR